jgi:hypothetical protein
MRFFLQRKIIYQVILLVFIAAMLLPSCTNGTLSAVETISPTAQDTIPTGENPLDLLSQSESEIAPTPTRIANQDPTESVLNTPSSDRVPLPTVRSDIEATDPKLVELASGKPQLIEFFAFW